MRIRIGKKILIAIGICAGILAAIVISFRAVRGSSETNTANIGELVDDDTTVTEETKKEETGIGAIAGITAGVSVEAEKQETEAPAPTEEQPVQQDAQETQETQAAQTAQPAAASSSSQAEAQYEVVTYTTEYTAAPQNQQASTTVQTQNPTQQTQKATEASNAEQFRGQPGAGNVDVGGEVNSDAKWYSSVTPEPEVEEEAFGGGSSEYIEE